MRYTDHAMLTAEDLVAFESLLAAHLVKGVSSDPNWDLVLTHRGSNAKGEWEYTIAVFRPPHDTALMTRPVPPGYVEMHFDEAGRALPGASEVVADAAREAALARSTARGARPTGQGPASTATSPGPTPAPVLTSGEPAATPPASTASASPRRSR